MGKSFLKSIGAGIIIGIVAFAFLSITNPIVGSMLFSFGLMTILIQDYYLYTGKVGSAKDIELLIIILIGNAIGAIGLGLILWGIGNAAGAGLTLAAAKISKSLLQTFISSILCGVVMELTVANYKESKKIIPVIFGIMIFILSGFEHCIANMFFFAFSGIWSIKHLIINIIGNTIGAIVINRLAK